MKKRVFYLSSKIGLLMKLLMVALCVLFCYIGYTISILHCIGVFVVFNLLFAIGPAIGSAPFVFVYNGFLYSLGESVLFWSRKRVTECVRLKYGHNSFVLTTSNNEDYKIKDFYSYLFPIGFIRKEERKEKLESKLHRAGFNIVAS